MKKAILATKIGMTQIFNADGVLVPELRCNRHSQQF